MIVCWLQKNAEKVDRTPDLMIFSHTLSQLSYLGFYWILLILNLTILNQRTFWYPYVIRKSCKPFADSLLLLSSTPAVCITRPDSLVVALLKGCRIVVEFTFKPAEGDEVEVECDENENLLEIAQSNDVEVKSRIILDELLSRHLWRRWLLRRVYHGVP